MSGAHGHIPVMLDEIVAAMAPRDGDVYVDGTFGAGGYTCALLGAADCRVVALDRDPEAVDRAYALQPRYANRLLVSHTNFGAMQTALEVHGITQVDGIVLDIGVSSYQIDEAARGFSFMKDGPLDMRMDTTAALTAAGIVNSWPQEELANLIWRYGEERASRRIAAAIVAARATTPLQTTRALVSVIEQALGSAARKAPIHPATRTFQALRIAVNDELGELERALQASLALLKPEGRLVVVSFHSLEDSIVKDFMVQQADREARPSRHMPVAGGPDTVSPLLRLPQRKALKPTDAECARNPRARSARLRCAIRTSAPIPERSAA